MTKVALNLSFFPVVNFSKKLEETGSLKRMSTSILRKFISLQIHHISDRVPREERKYFFAHGV